MRGITLENSRAAPTPNSLSCCPRENSDFSMPRLDVDFFCCCLENMATLIICPSDPNQAWSSSTSFMTCLLTGRVFSTRAWDTSLVQKMEETQITTWPGHCKTHLLRGTWESAGGHVVKSVHLVGLKPTSEKHPPPQNTKSSSTPRSYHTWHLGIIDLCLPPWILWKRKKNHQQSHQLFFFFFFLRLPIQGL